eukprot:Opistho-1_new@16870
MPGREGLVTHRHVIEPVQVTHDLGVAAHSHDVAVQILEKALDAARGRGRERESRGDRALVEIHDDNVGGHFAAKARRGMRADDAGRRHFYHVLQVRGRQNGYVDVVPRERVREGEDCLRAQRQHRQFGRVHDDASLEENGREERHDRLYGESPEERRKVEICSRKVRRVRPPVVKAHACDRERDLRAAGGRHRDARHKRGDRGLDGLGGLRRKVRSAESEPPHDHKHISHYGKDRPVGDETDAQRAVDVAQLPVRRYGLIECHACDVRPVTLRTCQDKAIARRRRRLLAEKGAAWEAERLDGRGEFVVEVVLARVPRDSADAHLFLDGGRFLTTAVLRLEVAVCNVTEALKCVREGIDIAIVHGTSDLEPIVHQSARGRFSRHAGPPRADAGGPLYTAVERYVSVERAHVNDSVRLPRFPSPSRFLAWFCVSLSSPCTLR